MRLELRRKLHPYKSLRELADAFEVTVPQLKKCLRELEAGGEVSLVGLAQGLGVNPLELNRDDLFMAFYRRELCLVCGSPLAKVEGRQAGWGEFTQCGFCGYSAHENADFVRLREVAEEKLRLMRQAMDEAVRVFERRERNGSQLTNPEG